MCCRNNITVSSLTAAAMAKATVGFNDLECRPSESKIWSAAHRIRRFRVQTDRFIHLEIGPWSWMILSANRPVPRFDVLTVEFDDLECKPPNSMIANADHQIT